MLRSAGTIDFVSTSPRVVVMRRAAFGHFVFVLLSSVALAACGAVRLPVWSLNLGPRCPFEDESFCEFVLELEAALESRDAQAFLGLVQLLDCQQYGHGFYGPVPEDFCGSSQWCFRQSHFFGEGTCVPLPDRAAIEDVLGSQYLSIDGIVYPGFPKKSSSAAAASPAVLIRVSGLADMRALTVVKASGEWRIASIHPYEEGIGEQLGASGTIIPWGWPYEKKLAWLGMQLPLDTWQVGTHPWDAEMTRYAVLSHRSQAACRMSLLAQDPYFLAGQPQDWIRAGASAETDAVRANEVRYSGPDGRPTMNFFEVFDISLRQVSYLRHLGYFLLETADPSEECADAVRDLLLTLDPAEFPDLPVAQG